MPKNHWMMDEKFDCRDAIGLLAHLTHLFCQLNEPIFALFFSLFRVLSFYFMGLNSWR